MLVGAPQTGSDQLDRVITTTDRLRVDARGVLCVEGCTASELVAEFGSPLFVLSEATIRDNFRAIRSAFQNAWPSAVNVKYAIKANNNFAVRAILHEEGAGGDCFGEGELYATFVGGADPETIVLNGSNKSKQELDKAVSLGVCVNVDAEDELDYLEEITRDQGRTARVNLRLVVVPDEYDPLGTMAAYSWGYSPESAIPLVKRMMAAEHLDFLGFHMHLGRMSPNPAFYRSWASLLAEAIVELHRATGFVPRALDVGGGFPRHRDVEAGHDPDDPGDRAYINPFSIDEYARVVCDALRLPLEARALPYPELSIEPGRFIVGSAGILLATVGVVKSHSGNTWANVDASINNLMMRETRDYEYFILPASKMHEPFEITAFVNGPLCVGKPLGRATPLPRVARNDVIAFLDAGMYAETLSTQMNGVPRPATVLVSGGSAEVIKERETVSDVFAHYRLPERFHRVGPG